MTRVCLLGRDGSDVRFDLLSRETARDALSTYDVREPYENTLGVETVSLGAAVALLNDLDWYLSRFVAEAMVLEPSVDGSEWLSRELATAIRDDDLDPEVSDRYCKVYGLEPVTGPGSDDPTPGGDDGVAPPGGVSHSGEPKEEEEGRSGQTGPGRVTVPPTEEGTVRYRLVEPMYATRTDGGLPAYDLREVAGTLVERVTESEFVE